MLIKNNVTEVRINFKILTTSKSLHLTKHGAELLAKIGRNRPLGFIDQHRKGSTDQIVGLENLLITENVTSFIRMVLPEQSGHVIKN